MKPTAKPVLTLFSILGILMLCAQLGATAQVSILSPFIRAGADFNKLKGIQGLSGNASWKDKLNGWETGYFGEAGVRFLGSHTLAAEVGWMKATDSATGTEKVQIPLLLNYRNSLLSVGPVSIYLGLSAGMMSDKMRWRDDISKVNFKSAKWVGLYGATAGVGLKLGAHWAVDLGVRALAVSAKAFEDGDISGGQSHTIGKTGVYIRPNARLALSCQW